MKQIVKRALRALGWEIRRIGEEAVGSVERPIGDVRKFLEDIQGRGFAPRGMLDVGANRGDWTRMARSVFGECPVIMIEPQQEMRAVLERFCRENTQLEWIAAGAGRAPGELVQTIWRDLAGSSFLPEVSQEAMREGRQRLTPIVTIDDILRERPGFLPDLVKLDVQGFELEALSGGASLFGRTEVFILETSLYRFHPRMPLACDCLQFMADRGYHLYDVTDYLRRPSDGALGQIDFAFARTGGKLRESSSW